LTTLAMVAGLALAGCASSDAAAPVTRPTVAGVGVLPGTLAPPPTTSSERVAADRPGVAGDPGADGSDDPDAPDDPVESTRSPEPRIGVDEGRPLGRVVEGNRVLVIGDSILASISNRYGDQLCGRLVPRGWVVEVDAEVSRSIGFGRRVLDRHDGDEWDGAVVMLGNNYDGDAVAFAAELDQLLDELEPVPVLLLNVTRFEPEQDEVNYLLAGAAEERVGVRLLDWASRTAEDAPGADHLLTGDGLHLSTAGQEALAAMISGALGRAPTGSEGECLDSPFDDDSGGTVPRETDES